MVGLQLNKNKISKKEDKMEESISKLVEMLKKFNNDYPEAEGYGRLILYDDGSGHAGWSDENGYEHPELDLDAFFKQYS